jgi:hypothetical protein
MNSNMNSKKYIATTLAALALLAAPLAFAETTVSAAASIGSGSGAKAQVRISDAKSRADQEITRRIAALTDLNSKVEAMAHVSASEKAAISTEAQNEISTLTSLKSTIDAETTIANLKTDIQSITKDYRIFMLVIPQGRIEVASDKIQTVTALYTALAGKLQTRIAAAQTAGKDVTSVESSLSDMNAKIAAANAESQAAVSLVANLQPDQGVQATMQSNETALKNARADVKTAMDDLKTARQDAGSIAKTLQSWHLGASASSTTSVQ